MLRDQNRGFSGDRAFSVRDQFPDVWYELSNPETVANGASRMRATLPTRRADFPPHVEGLAVQDLSLFCLRKEGFTQELRINSLRYTVPGQEPVTTAEVRTTGGIIGTRRPNGAPWQVLVGQDPVGEWSMQLDNTPVVRSVVQRGLDRGPGPRDDGHWGDPAVAVGTTVVARGDTRNAGCAWLPGIPGWKAWSRPQRGRHIYEQ